MMSLFEEPDTAVSQTAWACVVYSMVPYLGILFVPLAFGVGMFGIYKSSRSGRGGKRLAVVSSWAAGVILVVQIFLWWLLFFAPTLNRHYP